MGELGLGFFVSDAGRFPSRPLGGGGVMGVLQRPPLGGCLSASLEGLEGKPP